MAPSMKRSDGNRWELELTERVAGAEFKLVMCRGSEIVEWEPCENRRIGSWPESNAGTMRLVFGDPSQTKFIAAPPPSELNMAGMQVCDPAVYMTGLGLGHTAPAGLLAPAEVPD